GNTSFSYVVLLHRMESNGQQPRIWDPSWSQEQPGGQSCGQSVSTAPVTAVTAVTSKDDQHDYLKLIRGVPGALP
ncbi:hypothetical protein, partial [endosymbiont of Lamellibrachia barhami]|uniref:hypothetical protein n=1 Tax=endosymbiont of Lamellibrachia barhami TaxID=205975 RepID=UPI001C4B68F3